MEIQRYAPVMIPTLNRYEHFKRCLDSLERCTGADKTDVYVGLDYPPSEKYVEGWKKIDEYLKDKERSNGFCHLYVRRRDHNCGVGKPGSNAALLLEEIRLVSDTYITSEDDNEFSPNFLEFMNKGLEKYADDPKVIYISGYVFPDINKKTDKTDSFLSPMGNAWGQGKWFSKLENFAIKDSKVYIDDILHSWKKSWWLYRRRATSLNNCLSMHFRKEYYGDCLQTIKLLEDSYYSLFPSVSKVRNWGHDGTGLHCGFTKIYEDQEIDSNVSFSFMNEPPIINIANDIDFGITKKIATLVRYIGYKLTDKDWMSFYWTHIKNT